MKRPFTALMNEEESADSVSTAAVNTNQVYLDENSSALLPSLNNDNNDGSLSESEDALSESSKKMRKKRNAYQKISDDIRVDLLEAVKNGETLKAAAKRHKINYSSAKSILHTYRKEGRILKKSAQERTTKKKSGLEVEKSQSKSSKSKKENGVADENNYKSPNSLEVITKKVKTQTFVNSGESALPLTPTNRNRINLPQNDFTYEGSSKTVPVITISNKTDDKLFDHEHPQEHNFINGLNSRVSSRKGSMQFNFNVNFGDMGFPDFSHMVGGDNFDFMNCRRFSQDFSALNDVVNAINKPGQNEEHFHDHNNFFNPKGYQSHTGEEQKNSTGKVENLLDYDDHGKGLMENQRMFRNTLRKASFLSFGSNSGFRKGSFDLF